MPKDKVGVFVGGLPFQASPEEADSYSRSEVGNVSSLAEADRAYNAQKNLDRADSMGTGAKTAAGLFSGLTLGLGPAAMSATGLTDPGLVNALKEQGVYQGADIAGMLLGSLATGGGEGEGALLARALGITPAGVLAKVGSGAERLAARVLPETTGVLGEMAGGAVRMAARGSAEGAMINMAHTVSDNIVQDAPLTAQAIAAAGVDGALFGGLLGAGTGAAMGGLGGVLKGAESGVIKKLHPEKGFEATQKEILEGLNKDFPDATPDIGRVMERIGTEAPAASLKKVAAELERLKPQLKVQLNEAMAEVGQIEKPYNPPKSIIGKAFVGEAPELGPIEKPFAAPKNPVTSALKGGQFEFTEHPMPKGPGAGIGSLEAPELQHFEHPMPQEVSSAMGGPTQPELHTPNVSTHKSYATWKDWLKVRDNIKDQAVRNIIDSEMRTAMEAVDPKIAEQWAAARAGLETAKGISEIKAAQQKQPMFKPHELAYAAGGAMLGHPLGAAAYLASRAGSRAMGDIIGLNTVSGQTAHAVAMVRNRINKALTGFVIGGNKAANEYRALNKKNTEPLTRDRYERELERAEALVSASHKSKVQQYANEFAEHGHADVANEMVNMNQRAIDYLNANMPVNRKIKQMQSLRPLPIPKGLDMKEFKFLRIFGAIKNPLSILDKLEDGSLSRDEVRAVKYVAPELHQEIVATATQQIAQMKSEGKYMDLQKISNLGVILDAPIDRTLEPDYISAVQQSLKTNPAQAAANPPGPKPEPAMIDQTLLTPIDQQLIS
jgi:hypothetical protein